MAFNRINRYHPEGKKTYYINGQKFYNSKGERDGKEKAIKYCLDNFLNSADIITFDSDLECSRYIYLKELENASKIKNLGVHYLLKVQDEFINANGDFIPAITYNADFIYQDVETGKRVVEDVKGASLFEDTRFLIEKQLFDFNFKDKGLYIKVILWRNKEWIEWKIGDKKKPSKLIKKQREQIKALQKEQHEKEILNNKIERYKKRYNELLLKQKLNSNERKRMFELEAFLTLQGVLINGKWD